MPVFHIDSRNSKDKVAAVPAYMQSLKLQTDRKYHKSITKDSKFTVDKPCVAWAVCRCLLPQGHFSTKGQGGPMSGF